MLVASFRHRERDREPAAFAAWFRAHGYRDARLAEQVNEGEGDHLVFDGEILAGCGWLTRGTRRSWSN